MKCKYAYNSDIECTDEKGEAVLTPSENDCLICHIQDNTKVLKQILDKLP